MNELKLDRPINGSGTYRGYASFDFDLTDDQKEKLSTELSEFDKLWDNIKEYSKEVLGGEIDAVTDLKNDSVSFNVIINGVKENHTIGKLEIRNYKIDKITKQ